MSSSQARDTGTLTEEGLRAAYEDSHKYLVSKGYFRPTTASDSTEHAIVSTRKLQDLLKRPQADRTVLLCGLYRNFLKSSESSFNRKDIDPDADTASSDPEQLELAQSVSANDTLEALAFFSSHLEEPNKAIDQFFVARKTLVDALKMKDRRQEEGMGRAAEAIKKTLMSILGNTANGDQRFALARGIGEVVL